MISLAANLALRCVDVSEPWSIALVFVWLAFSKVPKLLFLFFRLTFAKNSPKNVSKKRRRSNVVEKFREVSDSVWVSFEAVIIENTLTED